MSRSARISTPSQALESPTIVVPVVFDGDSAFVAESIPSKLAGHEVPRNLSSQWCVRHGLKADAGSCVVLRSVNGPSLVFVSLGSSYNVLENYRLAAAAAQTAGGGGDVAFLLPTEATESARDATEALVSGALLSGYNYKQSGDEGFFDVVPMGSPLPSVPVHDAVAEGVSRGMVIAGAVNWAKRLIDTPASSLPPKELARHVELRLSEDPHVRVETWTESRIREERLGGLLGVGEGSAQPTRLVYATYDPQPGTELPHVALVGKGVTFDSGGLSLKSGDGMMTMKTDMSGAAIVMSALSVVSRLGLAIRVTAIAPMTENLPSDKAMKPGDVLTFRNGMTAEVLNTDAEGRLILADALSLAVEANPDAIVDVATLTGAQAVALGEEIGALYASTDELANYFSSASARSGESLWRMPLFDRYESHIESDIADMKNMGEAGKAGSISAALFLRRFTDGRPWVHLDIAGPGRCDTARGYVTKGATAFGARTIVDFIEAVVNDASKG